jgi:hypothetical protein
MAAVWLTAARAMVAAAVLSLATSTASHASCQATLRGDLVQAEGRNKAAPGKFLFFTLVEVNSDRTNGAISRKPFQSFVVPNDRSALPIPFVLDVYSPSDCPSGLRLLVSTHNTDAPLQFHVNDDPMIAEEKVVDLKQFQRIPVWASTY